MCGRYNFTRDAGDMAESIVEMMDRRYPGEYKTGEIFPGDTAPGVISDSGRIVPVPAVFGLPGFSDGKLIINARSETAAEKPMFSDSLRDRRLLKDPCSVTAARTHIFFLFLCRPQYPS